MASILSRPQCVNGEPFCNQWLFIHWSVVHFQININNNDCTWFALGYFKVDGVPGPNRCWRMGSCLKNWGHKTMLNKFQIYKKNWGPWSHQLLKKMVLSEKNGIKKCNFFPSTHSPWTKWLPFHRRCIFVNEKFRIFIEISLKFVPKHPVDNKPALV